MNRIVISVIFLSVTLTVRAQDKMIMTLDNALQLAQSQSLQSFLVKNSYLAQYWQYQSFKADYLPSLSLRSNLLTYSNANQLRYNSLTQTDGFVRTKTLNSDASLSLRQNVGVTGGTFYVNSDLGRIENYGTKGFVQYSSSPIRIGYNQELFGYNHFKWNLKSMPKEFEKAKLEYLQNVEKMNLTTCSYFFQLVLAKTNQEMAAYNYRTIDTLLSITRKRFDLGTISKDELLDLELNLNNAAITLEESLLNLRKSKEAFLSFLRLPLDADPELVLPDTPDFKVSDKIALEQAMINNAEILDQQLILLEAERQVAQTRAQNRFQASLGVSYGINKADGQYDYENNRADNGSIGNVYQPEFENYQQLNVGLTIPILDWGKRKGQYMMAKSRQEVTRIATEQTINLFQQNVVTKVMEFNIRKNKVASAAKSDTLALNSYELAMVRFRKGSADVLKLTSSQKAKDNAKLQYIQSLSNYWSSYFEVRHLTLYDFRINQPLEVDFEQLLKLR